jgi:hypothetical protein
MEEEAPAERGNEDAPSTYQKGKNEELVSQDRLCSDATRYFGAIKDLIVMSHRTKQECGLFTSSRQA